MLKVLQGNINANKEPSFLECIPFCDFLYTSFFLPITLMPTDFRENGDIKFLTKGDNNSVDDRGLYKQGQHWLEKKDVVGRARG